MSDGILEIVCGDGVTVKLNLEIIDWFEIDMLDNSVNLLAYKGTHRESKYKAIDVKSIEMFSGAKQSEAIRIDSK